MSRPPPQPIFLHRGLEGGATSCAVVSSSTSSGILVGTGKGRCELYDPDTHILIRTVYGNCHSDLQVHGAEGTFAVLRRATASCYFSLCPLRESRALSNFENCHTALALSALHFFENLHVDEEERVISSVGQLGDSLWIHVRNHAVLMLDADDVPRMTLATSHCGYCRTIATDEWLIYPDTKDERHYLRFWSKEVEDRRDAVLKNLPLSITMVEDVIFVGDEAGTLQKLSSKGDIVKEVSLFSEPIFCLAATSTSVACGSSKPPLVLLPSNDIGGDRRKLNYPPCSRGVGSVAFTTSGKTLVAGFWDGSIRVFSVQKLTILLYLDLHSQTISQMLWSEINGEQRLIVACMDEKLSLWKLK